MVEHVIGNDEVSSSNLLSSSKIPITKVVGIFSFCGETQFAPASCGCIAITPSLALRSFGGASG